MGSQVPRAEAATGLSRGNGGWTASLAGEGERRLLLWTHYCHHACPALCQEVQSSRRFSNGDCIVLGFRITRKARSISVWS